MSRADHLVTVTELQGELAGDAPPTLLDVRWALGATAAENRAAYEAGHVPGAIFVDLDRDLADHGNDDPKNGRHPLPTHAALRESARRWGLTHERAIVLYDDNGSQSAARGWWVLRWAGFENVRVLDGALAAWREAGLPLTTDAPSIARTDVEIETGRMPTLGPDEALACAREGSLLDARPGPRFRGEVEPLDPRAGHIPGAVNAPSADNLVGQRFASEAELRDRYDALGALGGPVGVSCGSGVTACHDALALATLGVEAALYPGSWSAWSNDPSRPVEVG